MDARELVHKHRFSRWLHRLTHWMHEHKLVTAFLTLITLIIAIGLVMWSLFYTAPVANKVEIPAGFTGIKALPEKKITYSPLTGSEIADETATKRQVTGIMIENSPDARPQSGLKDAGIVYEAIAEGGITRFAALYQEARPGLIGPVRSLRPYYLEWQAPYQPAFAHVGGSKKALDTVRNGQYKDIDQFFNAGAYYRAGDRVAPHNVYTTFDRLDALNQSKGFTSSEFQGWPRKGRTFGPVTAGQISVDISGPLYNSSYVYDQKNNVYVRSQNGAPHNDREAGQITPRVVVVMKVNMSLGFEDGYREQIETNGSGQAWIFQDGSVQEVTWQKNGTTDPLKLTRDGKEVTLNRGQTWVTAVPSDGGVSWK